MYQERRVPRRWILAGAATLVGIPAAYCVIRGLNPPDVALEANSRLAATATALKADGGKGTTFEPYEAFTPEVFNLVNQATFKITAYQEKFDNEGTAWLISKEDNSYYFGTAGHVFDLSQPITRISVYRPQREQQGYSARNFRVIASNNYDFAVIKCELPAFRSLVQPLSSIDNTKPIIGDSVLVCGYPGAFQIGNSNDYITLANVARVSESTKDGKKWVVDTLTGLGSSGSPVIGILEGVPTVMGVVSGAYIKEYQVYPQKIVKSMGTVCQSIDFANLKRALS